VMAKVLVSPASGSLATTVPTLVPVSEFSGIVKLCGAIVGGSLTLRRLIVTVVVANRPPASVTLTASAKLGVVSKSSGALSATVIAPVGGSIAKPPASLPAVMAKVLVSPASGSLATT